MMNEFQTRNFSGLMGTLRTRYVNALKPVRDGLARFQAKAAGEDLVPADLDEIGAIAHKLAGNGATYGFNEISARAVPLKNLTAADSHHAGGRLTSQLGALVEACDAAIASEIDQGTSLAPVYPNPGAIRRPTAPVLSAISADQPLVLVVDDDPSVRDMLKTIAGKYARVRTADDGPSALEQMRAERPDLVLLDEHMPGDLPGARLQEIMRDDSALCFVPVIFVTASGDTGSVLRGLTGGAADYIIKPIDPDLVSARIVQHLRKIGTDILIVEDDISVASLLEHRFAAAGFRPHVTGHGGEALDLMRHRPPDLIVLDRNLPDAEGADVLTQMRAIPGLEATPVAFLTARDSDDDMRDGYARGAADYIAKPFDADDVVSRCARLLTASSQAA